MFLILNIPPVSFSLWHRSHNTLAKATPPLSFNPGNFLTYSTSSSPCLGGQNLGMGMFGALTWRRRKLVEIFGFWGVCWFPLGLLLFWFRFISHDSLPITIFEMKFSFTMGFQLCVYLNSVCLWFCQQTW